MRPIEEIKNQTNALLANFLLIDSQTAMKYLDWAESSWSRAEDRARRFQAANKAYDTIVKLLPRTTLTQGQHEILMQTLTVLRVRLNRH